MDMTQMSLLICGVVVVVQAVTTAFVQVVPAQEAVMFEQISLSHQETPLKSQWEQEVLVV
jgi:hypothetical protein